LLIPCPFKFITHLDCPGCGFQRAIVALIAGDLQKSWMLYPPAIPFLLSAIMGMGKGFFKWKISDHFLKICYVLTGLVTVANYVYKIFSHQLY
jgi:hypothetical protein